METVTDNLKDTPNSTMSFFKYVFNFDDDNKSAMFNLSRINCIPVEYLFDEILYREFF